MASVRPLIGFGVGLIAGGFLWKLYDDTMNEFIISFVRSTVDKYYVMSDLVWNALPFAIIFLGIICLLFGGIVSVSNPEGGKQ